MTWISELVLPALRFVVETTEKAINEADHEQSDKLFRTLTFLGHYLADVLLNSAAAANVVSIQHFQSMLATSSIISNLIMSSGSLIHFELCNVFVSSICNQKKEGWLKGRLIEIEFRKFNRL